MALTLLDAVMLFICEVQWAQSTPQPLAFCSIYRQFSNLGRYIASNSESRIDNEFASAFKGRDAFPFRLLTPELKSRG
jgi:hypothetical protein